MQNQPSAFADITRTERVTLSTGHTVDLRAELGAEETYLLLQVLRQPPSPERGTQILLTFVTGWSLVMPDGSPCAVSASSLGMLRVPVRMELDRLVDDHMSAFLRTTFPDELKVQEAGDDPTTADQTDGVMPSSASA